MAGPDDPRSPGQLREGWIRSQEQSPGTVGQLCELCPDNWVETGAIDEATGEPLPGVGYRIYDIATGNMVGSGVLDAQGRSPRHDIPQPVQQLYVVFGTRAAMDEAAGRIEEVRRQRALAANARPDWNGIPAGLDEEGFNRAFDEASMRRGEMIRRNPSLIGGSAAGWKRAFDYVASGFDRESADREFYLDERAKSFDEYELATGAREASRWESFGGGAGQGVSFGFGDEGMAGIDAMLSGRTYEEAVEARRQIMEAQRIANPNTFIGGEVAGAVPTIFVPVGGAAANAARAGRGAAGAVRAGAADGRRDRRSVGCGPRRGRSRRPARRRRLGRGHRRHRRRGPVRRRRGRRARRRKDPDLGADCRATPSRNIRQQSGPGMVSPGGAADPKPAGQQRST